MAVAEACQRLLAKPVTRIEFPGGRSRKSVRAHLANGSVIVTRRRSEGRAALEADALRQLGARSAAVPRLLAFDGIWLIQEDLGGSRLSQALAVANTAGAETLLESAITALADLHDAGRVSEFGRHAPIIGSRTDWLERFASMPARIGEHATIAAPALAVDAIVDSLRIDNPTLVKWDSRPGNAMVRDGAVVWVDWEHCGRRDPLDDIAWLLADEFTPDFPEIEDRLLDRFQSLGAARRGHDAARAYLGLFGSLHMCVRFGLILSRKGDGGWWDADYCLRRDKIGVTREAALRVCARGRRWAGWNPLVQPLADWWARLADHLASLERN